MPSSANYGGAVSSSSGGGGANCGETGAASDSAASFVIQQGEIVDIINALKMQHEFINETETTFQIYQQVKTRAEAFYRFEFCSKNDEADDPIHSTAEEAKHRNSK